MDNLYFYKAVYLENYDGDTIRFNIDLGFGIWQMNQAVRLYGVNTPELRSPTLEEGRKAKRFVSVKLNEADQIIIKTHKDRKGKYGRWLAEVFVDGVSLNEMLVRRGLAERYMV